MKILSIHPLIPSTTPYPLVSHHVPAGFPSPAEDSLERSLSLDELLIVHPESTFFVRVSGDSMQGAGIFPHDILVVDKQKEAVTGSIIIAVVNGEMTVKRLYRSAHGTIELHAENPHYLPITFHHEEELMIWGVVVGVVRTLNT